MAKAKTRVASYVQAFAAKRLLAEATKMFEDVDLEVEKAKKSCAPLLEHGGEEFLVTASIKTLSAGLCDHMSQKGLKREELYKAANGGKAKGALKREAFLAYLDRIPDEMSNESMALWEYL